MADDEFGELLRAHVEETLAGMSDSDYAALQARVRPPQQPTDRFARQRVEMRAVQAAKAQQLAALPEPNGFGPSDAFGGKTLDLGAPATQPPQVRETPWVPEKMRPNRGQGQSGNGGPPIPVSESTAAKIAKLLGGHQ